MRLHLYCGHGDSASVAVASAVPERREARAGRTLAPMDLHVIAPLPSPAERAAVDAVVGANASGWAGGPRDPATEGHVSYGGHAARARRDLLLPALRAVQDRVGFMSRAGARLHLPAPERPARHRVWRRELLRAPRDQVAAAGGRACLRRRRVPAGRCRDRRSDLDRALGPEGANPRATAR